jgi:tRNA (guanine-N7-)-methyltransferase
MSVAQKRSYDSLFPRFGLDFPAPVHPDPAGLSPSGAFLDFAALFGNQNPVTVEIGFGMGVATAQIADDNRDKNYLGLEVHRPGIGRLLWEIERRGLTNIRIIEHDAVEVFAALVPDRSLEALHVFFPDPWPKKRHHKRRLITRPFTELLAQKLQIGGYLYMVTDWADYAEWALAELSATTGLVNRYDAYAPHQAWRPETKFEVKGLAQEHAVWELLFEAKGPAQDHEARN